MGCKPSPFLFVIVVQANRIKSEILDSKTDDVNCTCLRSKRTESPHVDTQFMKEGDTFFEFAQPEHIKQSRPGYKVPSVLLQAHPVDQSLCFYSHERISTENKITERF